MREEEKEQWNKLKDKSFKDKFNYFWYYYKYHTIGAITVIICLIIFIYGLMENGKEPSIYLALINSGYMSVAETSLMDDFVESRSIDTDTHPARFDISMSMTQGIADNGSIANSQKLMALFNSHDLDVIISDKWVVEEYAPLSAFADLEELLPPDLYEKIQDKLFYYTYEDGETVPIGFYGDKLEKLMKDNAYSTDNPPVVTIASTSERLDTAVDFIRYLLEE